MFCIFKNFPLFASCEYVLKTFAVYVEFKNTKTKSPINNGLWLSTNSVEGFLLELWDMTSDKIKREIICDPAAHTQTFSDKEIPDVSDIARFVRICDTVGHAYHNIDDVTDCELLNWSDGRKLEIHVYPYGTTVVTKAQWTKIHKGQNALVPAIQTDRAGAPTEAEVEAIVEQLKEIHRFHYSAPHITWRAWADFILKKKPEERELFMRKPPPYKLIDLFRPVHVNADIELAAITNDVTVAESVSEGVILDIDGLINSYECQMVASKARRAVEKAVEKTYLYKLKAFKVKMDATHQTLNVVSQRARPHENAMSLEYLESIGNQEDVDHMEYLEEYEDQVILYRPLV